MDCLCSDLPVLIDYEDRPKGLRASLEEVGEGTYATLFRCQRCGQLWRLGQHYKRGVQFATKLTTLEGWDTTAYQSDLQFPPTAPKSYPDCDWPWPFYFNGHLMPKWSTLWTWAKFGRYLNDWQDEWDEFLGYRHFWHLECRIDHVGVVETEDPHLFMLAARAFLTILLVHEEEVLTSISNALVSYPDLATPTAIYRDLRDGLLGMLQRIQDDGLAFWTSGYEWDRVCLLDCIQRSRLPSTDPAYYEPSHLDRRRGELRSRERYQLGELHALAQSGRFDKEVRRALNQLKRTVY